MIVNNNSTTNANNTPKMLCCICGTVIPANPTSMCVNCIRSQVDITEGISKEHAIPWCKGCGRFAHNTGWVAAEPESKELLALLVRKVRGLSKVKLVDASFVWTEPHSKRLKVKLTVQKEVFSSGAVLQQAFVANFVLENHYCPDCHKAQSPHTWVAQVQLRQRDVGHKRTLYYVEQLILKRGAHACVVSMKEVSDGLDFYFVSVAHAKRFVDFLGSVMPTRVQRSKKLISHDDKSNDFNYKYTSLVEIPPICKDDLCVVPRGGRLGEGGIFLCTSVSATLHFVDPFTLRRLDVPGAVYWAQPFRPVLSATHLQEYTVIDAEPLSYGGGGSGGGSGEAKYALADVTVAKTSEFGDGEEAFKVVRTHLGRLLHAGDIAYAYDIASETLDFEEVVKTTLGKKAARDIPDIILVRKGRYRRGKKKRIWTLERISPEAAPFSQSSGSGGDRNGNDDEDAAAAAAGDRDMEMLMQELEDDPEFRASVALVKVPDAEKILEEQQLEKERKEEENAGDGDDVVEDDGCNDDDDDNDVKLDELVDASTLEIKHETSNAYDSDEDEDDEEEDAEEGEDETNKEKEKEKK